MVRRVFLFIGLMECLVLCRIFTFVTRIHIHFLPCWSQVIINMPLQQMETLRLGEVLRDLARPHTVSGAGPELDWQTASFLAQGP